MRDAFVLSTVKLEPIAGQYLILNCRIGVHVYIYIYIYVK